MAIKTSQLKNIEICHSFLNKLIKKSLQTNWNEGLLFNLYDGIWPSTKYKKEREKEFLNFWSELSHSYWCDCKSSH